MLFTGPCAVTQKKKMTEIWGLSPLLEVKIHDFFLHEWAVFFPTR